MLLWLLKALAVLAGAAAALILLCAPIWLIWPLLDRRAFISGTAALLVPLPLPAAARLLLTATQNGVSVSAGASTVVIRVLS